MLELDDATKTYGSRPALRGVSFTLDGPGIVGLLGPNGSGKTTTLRLMAGFFPPTRGRVLFDGRPAVEAAPPSVGYLPEQAPLYGEMTVADYLVFVARIKGLSRRQARAATDDVIGRLSLGERRDSLIGQLSRGLKQRVGIAQALVHAPSTILLDEPTSGLDPVQVEEARAVIRDAGQRATVVMSTHLLNEIALLCRRVIVLREGELAGELPAGASARLRLTVRGDLPAHREQLLARAGATEAAPPAAGAEGIWSLEVDAAAPDTGERLAAAAIAAGLAVRSLEPVTPDLYARYAELQQNQRR